MKRLMSTENINKVMRWSQVSGNRGEFVKREENNVNVSKVPLIWLSKLLTANTALEEWSHAVVVLKKKNVKMQ